MFKACFFFFCIECQQQTSCFLHKFLPLRNEAGIYDEQSSVLCIENQYGSSLACKARYEIFIKIGSLESEILKENVFFLYLINYSFFFMFHNRSKMWFQFLYNHKMFAHVPVLYINA